MKKTFPLEVSGKKTPRVIDSIKHEIRKYLKRERRKTLPEGADYWDFACRVGADSESTESVHVKVLNQAVDNACKKSASSIYIEVLSKPGHRTKKDSDQAKTESSKKS
ncbi:MAG: DUF6172 family protein [Verrucomicrobia bacterium]|nr:DUF6172 family protein [Verrucomicrobiota bacterium]